MPYRMIFMGSDPIALPGLNAIADGSCGDIEIVAIYTQPDRARGRGKKVVPNEIKIWALEKGIEVAQPERLKKDERLELESYQADFILVMAYGHILSQKLIDTPPLGIWNLHTSILPKYRGASPIQCAVASGDEETGVTLMGIVREMDAGPIVDVEKVGIGRLDTALDVDHGLSEACPPLLIRNIPRILDGSVAPRNQDSAKATFVRKLGKQDGSLDFRMSARLVAKRVNGLFPWPSTSFEYGGVVVKVGLADYFEEDSGREAGTVLSAGPDGLRVACSDGIVIFMRLQRPGGKMMEAEAFLRGFEMPADSVIESRNMPELVHDKVGS